MKKLIFFFGVIIFILSCSDEAELLNETNSEQIQVRSSSGDCRNLINDALFKL